MSDIPEFPHLNENKRRLIVNALKIVSAEFGSVKIHERGFTVSDYKEVLSLIYPSGESWNKGDRACAHGVVPAFEAKNRSMHCWACCEDDLRDKLHGVENSLNYANSEIDRLRQELDETWADPNKNVWRRPTAEAYGLVCLAYRGAEVLRAQATENLKELRAELADEVDSRKKHHSAWMTTAAELTECRKELNALIGSTVKCQGCSAVIESARTAIDKLNAELVDCRKMAVAALTEKQEELFCAREKGSEWMDRAIKAENKDCQLVDTCERLAESQKRVADLAAEVVEARAMVEQLKQNLFEQTNRKMVFMDKLKDEEDRHEFSVKKWMAERRELRDALIVERARLQTDVLQVTERERVVRGLKEHAEGLIRSDHAIDCQCGRPIAHFEELLNFEKKTAEGI